jgi:predicted acetyltransferase
MNNESLRILTPSDRPAYMRLMAQAFERGKVQKDTPYDENFGTETAGIWEGDQLRAALTIRPFTVHWRNAVSGTLSMGGVAGVATGIEARGRGHVDCLLRDSLVRMRAEGQVISALYPFAWAFYRKFGWEWVGEKRSVSLPLREIKATAEGRFVREVPSDAARDLLSPVYDRYAARYNGAFSPDSHQWSDKLAHSDDRTTFVYAYFPDGDAEPTAYLLWRYDAGGSDAGEIREFVAYTPAGYRALFGLLHYLGTQCRTARLVAPADAPLWSQMYHWEISTKIEPVFQARVVDVCAAMQQVAPPADLADGAAATVRISDDAAPWNQGVFRVTTASSKIECLAEPEADTAADMTMDIQAFSQAFWGAPSLPALRNAGRIEVSGEAGYENLCRILPANPVFTMDFF